MEHGKQEVSPSIPLGRTWSKFPEDMSQRDRLQRPYANNQRLESHEKVQTPGVEGKQDKGKSVTGALLSEEGLTLSEQTYLWRAQNKILK
ncbi:hypothetical protein O181_128282 [Austropuccinia psidii MF-1]|uniref:Uncharacterized protein n=1 Tax=Austropuccinia psidii MF-1 TaxID=1389203 RepID=A0A9Q3KWY9_9BASI|nr:hypothetical protein [Austropuccinia psidii MF-1]